jgi:hypothetical protein
MASVNHTPRHCDNHDRTVRTDSICLTVPTDLVVDLRPLARAHQTSVDRFILDILLRLVQEPRLTTKLFGK